MQIVCMCRCNQVLHHFVLFAAEADEVYDGARRDHWMTNMGHVFHGILVCLGSVFAEILGFGREKLPMEKCGFPSYLPSNSGLGNGAHGATTIFLFLSASYIVLLSSYFF